MTGECKLCGSPTGGFHSLQAGWNHRYEYGNNPNHHYHKTYRDLFNGKWNGSLNLFCVKHIHAIFHEYIYRNGCCFNQSMTPISTRSDEHFHSCPSDDDINTFLLKFLTRSIKQESEKGPLITCVNPTCIRWAKKEYYGKWLCGNHGQSATRTNIILRYGTPDQRSETDAARSENAVASLLNYWKKESHYENHQHSHSH